MATIREMAIEYAPHPASKDWDEMQKQLAKLSAYEAGAKAVLDEIVAMLPRTDKNLNDYGKALVWRLTEKIKELKGE